MKVWMTRAEPQQVELRFKGLLPVDRDILLKLGRKLAPRSTVAYCSQVAAMNTVDAQIMLARTRCKATTPAAKTVALRISDAHSDRSPASQERLHLPERQRSPLRAW